MPPLAGDNIMWVGNSQGVSTPGPGWNPFTVQVGEILRRNYHNGSISGTTVRDWNANTFNQCPGFPNCWEQEGVPNAPHSAVHIMLGTNCAFIGCPAATWRTDMDGLLAKIRTTSPAPKPIFISTAPEPLNADDKTRVESYNAEIQSIVNDNATYPNVCFGIDVFTIYPRTEPQWFGDTVHLSQAAHNDLSLRLAPVVAAGCTD